MVAYGKHRKLTFSEKVQANLQENYSFIEDFKKIQTLSSFYGWLSLNIGRVLNDYTGCWLLGCLLQLFVSATQIAVGVIKLDQCPAQPWIPIFLACQGSANFFSWAMEYVLGTIVQICKNKRHEKTVSTDDTFEFNNNCSLVKATKWIWFLFSFGWLIAGSIWLFGAFPEFQDETSKRYCDDFLYNNCLIWLIACYILATLAFYITVCGVILVCVNQCFAKRNRRNPDANETSDKTRLDQTDDAFDDFDA